MFCPFVHQYLFKKTSKQTILSLHLAVHLCVSQLHMKIQVGQQYGAVKLHYLHFPIGY